MSNLETTGGQTDQSIAATDAAVNAAKAKVAARKAAAGGSGAEGAPPAEGEKAKRKIYTPEERLARAQQLEADRAKRKADRKAASDAKKAEAQTNRGTPHMSKVEKAGAGLAPMDAETQAIFDEARGSLNQAQLDILTAHLAFHSRKVSTQGSVGLKLAEGTPVRIIAGPAKLIGKTGTVAKWQKVHCYITVPGMNKPAYLFNAQVEEIKAEASEPEAPASGEQASDEAAAA